MHWGCNGELSTLTVRFQLGRNAGQLASRLRPEQADGRIDIGDGIVLTQPLRAENPLVCADQEFFRGCVGRIRPVIQANPDREAFEATAYGPEIRLRGKAVGGQWCKTIQRDDAEMAGEAEPADARRAAVMATDLPVIFNEGGRPNATSRDFRLGRIYDHDGVSVEYNECKVFEAPGRTINSDDSEVQAVYWTAYTALRSLVEYVDDYDAISPHTDWPTIRNLLGGVPVGQVVVEGMNLLEAIRAVLLPVGFGFALEPWTRRLSWGGPIAPTYTDKHRLIVFSLRGRGRRRYPHMAPVHGGNVAADSRAGQRAQVQGLDFARDARHVANHVTVVGDCRRRQAVLEFVPGADGRDLHPLWDTETHDLADWINGDGVVDPRSNPPWTQANQEAFFERYNFGADHPLYKHVFRTFVWNEDAALLPVIEATPELSDFGTGDGSNWVRRPRPVGRTFLFDESAARIRTYPAMVQLGIDGDSDSWITIPASPLADRAGMTITRASLHDWFPYDRNDVPEALRNQYGSTGSTPVSYLTALYNALAQTDGPKLRLRLIGSIECDQAAKSTAERTAGATWPFLARRVIRADSRFRWRDVADDPFGLGADRHDTRDDRAAAADHASAVRDALEHCLGRGRMLLRGIVRAFRPGHAVPRTQGRQVNLSVDGHPRRYWPIVMAVNYDFREGAGKTELLLETPAMESIR